MEKKLKTKKYLSYIIYVLISGFITASGITLYIAHFDANILTIESVKEVDSLLLFSLTVIFATPLYILFALKEKLYRCCIPLSLFFFSVIVLYPSTSANAYFYSSLAIAVICVTVAFKDIFKDRKIDFLDGTVFKFKGFECRGADFFAGGAIILMTAAVSFGTVIRMYIFNSSTFDFGLFAQMYEYMATDFSQNSTLERNELLSHFAVHFSPVYYLLLPFYMIFRNPESLLVMQAAVCFSGAFPLLLLCRKWRYSGAVTLAVCGVFLCYPALTGACFYDFHENCFLTPFILWILYFLEENKGPGACVFALLLLCVKEDAGLYLIFIALYSLFNKKIKKGISIPLLIMGIAGFVAVTAFIDALGEGIKVSRYNIYLMQGQDSLASVVKNVIKNPAFFFSNLLSAEKVLFIVQMLLPLLFIPVRSRKVSEWFLIAPFILINLATDYKYQFNINFQYIFGTGAMLIFLMAKNMKYSRQKLKTALAALMAAAVCLVGNGMPRYHYADTYYSNPKCYEEAEALLRKIPRDKVIYACTFLTPHLYDCKELYMYPPIYNKENWTDADYILIDTRYFSTEELKEEIQKITSNGYVRTDEASFIVVYRKEKV